jgi:hypothetical protein
MIGNADTTRILRSRGKIANESAFTALLATETNGK